MVERSCLDEQAAYDVFVKSHPVTVDGTVPEKSQRVQLTGINDRHCYNRWLSEQMKLRVEHVLGEQLPQSHTESSRETAVH